MSSSSISQRSTEVTNPLHESSQGLIDERGEITNEEGFDLETIEPDHMVAPSLTNPEHISNKASQDPPGDSHDHGHGGAPEPSKVPMWIQDLVEKVFKVKKRKSTIEVSLVSSNFVYVLLF